jgi:hypothetical protein
MDDLDRLFRQLVDVLTTKDPQRLTAPFQISELYQSILPYRLFKKQLGFECNEDYEMALLRLFAGESNYAIVEPDEVKEQLALEAQAINPNPGAFREFAAARVKLSEAAVRSVRSVAQSFAPPPPPTAPKPEPPGEQWAQLAPPGDEPTEPIVKPPVFEAVDRAVTVKLPQPGPARATPEQPPAEPVRLSPSCPSCNETLPTNRHVVFCPFCGGQKGPATCPSCGDQIEVGWRFCITCGRGNSDS